MATRTLALQALRNAFAKSLQKNNPLENTTLSLAENPNPRREFLKKSLQAGSLVALSTSTACVNTAKVPNPPKIAIIGGGIAGMSAALTLKNAGITATIYEGSKRIGGRMYTANDLMGKGLTTDLGGEFIDTGHYEMLALCRDLEIELLDAMSKEESKLIGRVAHVNGKFISEKDLINAFAPISNQISRDIASLSKNIHYSTATDIEKTLDRQSIAEYVQKLGVNGWFYKLIDAAYTSEMSVDADKQSSLNMLTFLMDAELHFQGSNERYKVKGGMETIARKLAKLLENQINPEHYLEKVSAHGEQYKLHFANGKEITADAVIMAVPFTKLKEVTLDVPLSAAKKEAIANLRLGAGSKVFMGVNRRVWREQGYSGYVMHDVFQTGWDNSQCQGDPTSYGGYTFLLGGEKGKKAAAADADAFTDPLNGVFKGIKETQTDVKSCFNWATFPHSYGSYTTYEVGQWTAFGGVEPTPEGNIYFAGEHCSRDYQGFMNGAVKTARVAAESILKKLNAQKYASAAA